jgi:hypothetical protein
MRDFFNESRQMANSDPVRGYVFGSADRGRLADFLQMLETHRLEVYELAQPFTHQGQDFEPGEAFLIPLRQQQYRLVRGLFETRVIEDKVEFYDVSGWTQPLAYDLDYAELRGGQYRSQIVGERVTGFDMAEAAPDVSAIGYVMEWDSYYAPRALYRLLDAGVRARVIPDEISVQTTAGETELDRGSLMIELSRQPVSAEEIHALLVQAAEEDGVKVHAVTSSSTSRGSDLGGFQLSNVEQPEVLLVTGRGISMGDAGELWHLLDHDMHMPVSMIDQSELGGADLSRYTHIILPHGRLNRMGDDMPETLGAWVRDGGTLIATRGAARWVIEQELTSAAIAELETPEADAARPDNYDAMSQSGMQSWRFRARSLKPGSTPLTRSPLGIATPSCPAIGLATWRLRAATIPSPCPYATARTIHCSAATRQRKCVAPCREPAPSSPNAAARARSSSLRMIPITGPISADRPS